MNLKIELEKVGYYGTDELAMNMELLFNHELARDGLSSVCLTGLPGVGKTFLPQSLAKVFDYTYIAYTCDNKTGAEQLLEDMNIPMMVKKDHEKAITKGVLLRAVDAVNRGEKVILVIDEFDKAARETDFFFLEFLQSGKTTSATFGDVNIEPAFMNNLIVFICKNAERDVHEALMRRFNKFIEVAPPELSTVRQILMDAVPDADEVSSNAVISLYQMILEDAEDYKKLATIQEMKNALREDLVLKAWEKSEDTRMKNILGHIVKFPEDRLLLNAKLTDMGLIELAETETVREKDVYTTMSLEKFFVNGFSERVVQLEHQLEKVLNFIADKQQAGMLSFDHLNLDTNESDSTFQLPELTQPLTEISVLGTVTTQKVQTNGALPKHMYNRSIVSLSKKSALYKDEQYILAELQLERKSGTYDELLAAITAAKTEAPILDVMHDGIRLASDATNEIGLIHYIETIGMPPRIYLVANKPVLSELLLYNAIRNIPNNIINRLLVTELDVNMVTKSTFDEVSSRLDQVYDIAEDYSEVIGTVSNITVGYATETGMLKLKTTRADKQPLAHLFETAQRFVSIKKSEEPGFSHSRIRILSLKEMQNMAIQAGNFNLGDTSSNTYFEQFKEHRNDGNNFLLFASNDKKECFGVSKIDSDVIKYILNETNLTKEEWEENYIAIVFDGDRDFNIYQIKSNGDRNGEYIRYNEKHGGQKLEDFIKRNIAVSDDAVLFEKIVALNTEFESKKLA